MEGKWKGNYVGLSLFLFLVLSLTVSGCQSSAGNTKNENPVSISQSGFYVEEVSPKSYYVNVYCEYKNTSKDPIYITGINVIGYDKSNISLGDGSVNFSSYILQPDEVGYGIRYDAYGIKVNSAEELSRIDFKINTYKASVTDKLLSCTDTQIVQDNSFGDVNKSVIQTTVSNDTTLNVDADYSVIAGLLDSDNKMIGAATTLNRPNAISPNSKSRNDLQTLVLESDNLSTVKTIDVKAGMYLSVFDNDSFVKANREIVSESISSNTPTTANVQPTPTPEQTSSVNSTDAIIGKWKMTSPGTGAEGFSSMTFDFKSDGKVTMTVEEQGKQSEFELPYKKAPNGYNVYYNDKEYMGFFFKDSVLQSFFTGGESENSQSTKYEKF
ncbi:hypothetical protein [Eubacterium barkeri]|uniref:Uncharacterized protein n=1 Tax=Eubacterium barkeri TaxID=1528 RepID=A0A1H3BHS6_EUBBA|nr:hypothetical protein [Eubacterium barkeri]SDX40904.1 hypothetical protein SAMN04488579_10267 [Eubacterium barkeri]